MDQAEQLRNIIKAGNVKRSRPLARVITVTSGKGGVGKSNTSINLALQFQKMGKKVIILDADFGLANIEIMFGAVPKHNLSDLIYQGKNIKDIITWGPMEVGFISGGSGITGLSNLSKDYLTYIVHNLAELDTIADVIIVDTEGLKDVKIVCSDQVGGRFKTKNEFYTFVKKEFGDKINPIFLTSVNKNIDYLIWAGADGSPARYTSKVKSVEGYNARGYEIPIMTAEEFIRELKDMC